MISVSILAGGVVNTFGLFSVNNATFNLEKNKSFYPTEVRDLVVTLLKVSNLTLNVIGFISEANQSSGCIRMVLGGMICVIGFSSLSPSKDFSAEVRCTGAAQIVRGALEAYIPYGRIFNISLDAVATISNVLKDAEVQMKRSMVINCSSWLHEFPDDHPEYPHILKILHLA